MIVLRELTAHGPHYRYCQYLFIGSHVWLDFLGNNDHWARCPKIEECFEPFV